MANEFSDHVKTIVDLIEGSENKLKALAAIKGICEICHSDYAVQSFEEKLNERY
jgi:hypothetical protein